MEQNRSWKTNSRLYSQKNSSYIMEHKVKFLSKLNIVYCLILYLKYILILTYHLYYYLTNNHLRLDLPTKILCVILISPIYAAWVSHLALLDVIRRTVITFLEECICGIILFETFCKIRHLPNKKSTKVKLLVMVFALLRNDVGTGNKPNTVSNITLLYNLIY
jgi:hypothetical protein